MKGADHSAGARLSSSARRMLMRVVVWPSWVGISVLTALFAVGFEPAEPVQYAPFALSLVFLGLPHGAVDHLVPGRLEGGVSARSIAIVALLYATLASAYLVFWTIEPAAAFIFFILLTWFHWGQGDLYALRVLLRAQHPAPRTLKILTAVVRGGLPMLVPLLAFPGVYSEVAGSMVGIFSDFGTVAWIPAPAIRIFVAITFLGFVSITLLWGYRCSPPENRAAWALDVAEVGLLAAYFAVVPPIFAIGMYFCLWHAPRHIARLMLLNRPSRNALEKGRFLPALKDFALDATPLTAAALLLLAGLYFFVSEGVEGTAVLLAIYLMLISILTLPHVLIVGLMDRRQGVWR